MAAIVEIDTRGYIASLLPPDINQFEYLTGVEKEFLLKQRTTQYIEFGRQMGDIYKAQYGKDADIAISYEVFNQIAQPLNQIFISQVEKAKQTTWDNLGVGEVASWSMYNRHAAEQLRAEVRKLLSPDSPYRDFFRKNNATGKILEIIAERLLDEKTPAGLASIRNELERLALESNRDGKPIFLFTMSAAYTRSDPTAVDLPDMLEADLRLINPISEAARERIGIDDVLQKGWGRLREFHKRAGVKLEDDGFTNDAIIGEGIGFAGAQLVERTESERFSNREGFHISINLLKDVENCIFAFETLVDRYDSEHDRERVQILLTILNSFHEMSHKYTDAIKISPLLAEVTADISATAVLKEMIEAGELKIFDREITWGEFVAILLGEHVRYSLEPFGGTQAFTDSYPLSARYFLLSLIRSNLITVRKYSDGRSSIGIALDQELKGRVVEMVQQLESAYRYIYTGSITLSGIDKRFRGSDSETLALLFSQNSAESYIPSTLETSLLKIKERIDKYGEKASKTVRYLYDHTFKLRDDDRLVVIADSASDPAVVSLMAKEAKERYGIEVEIIYYRDIVSDTEGLELLRLLLSDGYDVRVFDLFAQGMDAFITGFNEGNYTVGMNLMNASYEARTKIGEAAKASMMPVGEMPTTDIETLTSQVYQEDEKHMSQIGDWLLARIKDVTQLHIYNPNDGTDFYIEVNPEEDWIDESKLDFSLRHDPQAPVDNIPRGEMYKNIKLGYTHGTLPIYQVDSDILDWAVRIKGLSPDRAKRMIIDFADPIIITSSDGYISDISGGERAEILREYIFSHQGEAKIFFTEVAAGINSAARDPGDGPGEGATAIVEMEKKIERLHIAIGNSPVRTGVNPAGLVTSDIHLDFVLRGGGLVDAITKTGSQFQLVGPKGLWKAVI